MTFSPLLQHDRHECANAMDHTPEIDPEPPFPVLQGLVPTRTEPTADTGIIADNMDCAESIKGFLCQHFHRVRLRHVGHYPECGCTVALHFFLRLPQSTFLYV